MTSNRSVVAGEDDVSSVGPVEVVVVPEYEDAPRGEGGGAAP